METFEQLVARVSANAFLGEIPVVRAKKLHRIARRAQNLTRKQLELLLQLLEGYALLGTVHGKPYAFRDTRVGWTVTGLDAGDESHTIIDGVCSCRGCRFRGTCRHIEALNRLHEENP